MRPLSFVGPLKSGDTKKTSWRSWLHPVLIQSRKAEPSHGDLFHVQNHDYVGLLYRRFRLLRSQTCAFLEGKTSALLRAKTCALLRAKTRALLRAMTRVSKPLDFRASESQWLNPCSGDMKRSRNHLRHRFYEALQKSLDSSGMFFFFAFPRASGLSQGGRQDMCLV